METGYLATTPDVEGLARGIHALLTTDRFPAIRAAAQQAATKSHTPSSVANRHVELYLSLLSNGAAQPGQVL